VVSGPRKFVKTRSKQFSTLLMENDKNCTQNTLLQIHRSPFSTPKPCTICPILIGRAQVMAVWCFAKTRFGRFLCHATRSKPRDSATFFSTRFVDLIFLHQNHIQYGQFWQLGQKLWQFEVLPKPYLAGFCVVQPGQTKRLCFFS